MRRLVQGIVLVAAVAALAVFGLGQGGEDGKKTYKIELDNAFGLVEGADIKVAGVRAGSIKSMDVNARKKAVVTVQLNDGLDSLRSDAFCETRPQSTIGEFFIDCQPGKSGKVLPPGATVPVEQTRSTIPPDLVNNVLRLPYKQRLRLIINELGTGLAGRPGDLNQALERANPALKQTNQVLAVLARQNTVIRQLVSDSDTIIGELARNRRDVARFIEEANTTAKASAVRSGDIAGSFRRLPRFLDELEPTMTRLGQLTDVQTPLLEDLRDSSGQLKELLSRLGPFSEASRPAVKTLGGASAVGRRALSKGRGEIDRLRTFARKAGRPSENLRKFLVDVNDPKRAVPERPGGNTFDPRSPKGPDGKPRGFTGLETFLRGFYVSAGLFNTFDQVSKLMRFFIFPTPCTNYFTAVPREMINLSDPKGPRPKEGAGDCVDWLGPNQPGVTTADPSTPIPGYTTCPPADQWLCILPEGASTTSTRSRDRGTRRDTPGTPAAAGPQDAASGGGSRAAPRRNGDGLRLQLNLPGIVRKLIDMGKPEGQQPAKPLPSPRSANKLLDFLLG